MPDEVDESSPQDVQAQSDAQLLTRIIIDNERWNDKGILESDVSVVFEMDAQCSWGSTFSVARLKRGLALAAGVTKRDDRWYATTNRRLGKLDTDKTRKRCERDGCETIVNGRTDRRYCSTRCRERDNRTAAAAQNVDFP